MGWQGEKLTAGRHIDWRLDRAAYVSMPYLDIYAVCPAANMPSCICVQTVNMPTTVAEVHLIQCYQILEEVLLVQVQGDMQGPGVDRQDPLQ